MVLQFLAAPATMSVVQLVAINMLCWAGLYGLGASLSHNDVLPAVFRPQPVSVFRFEPSVLNELQMAMPRTCAGGNHQFPNISASLVAIHGNMKNFQTLQGSMTRDFESFNSLTQSTASTVDAMSKSLVVIDTGMVTLNTGLGTLNTGLGTLTTRVGEVKAHLLEVQSILSVCAGQVPISKVDSRDQQTGVVNDHQISVLIAAVLNDPGFIDKHLLTAGQRDACRNERRTYTMIIFVLGLIALVEFFVIIGLLVWKRVPTCIKDSVTSSAQWCFEKIFNTAHGTPHTTNAMRRMLKRARRAVTLAQSLSTDGYYTMRNSERLIEEDESDFDARCRKWHKTFLVDFLDELYAFVEELEDYISDEETEDAAQQENEDASANEHAPANADASANEHAPANADASANGATNSGDATYAQI
jgi:X-X-X-Leu-X-X-Gly heptad repeat protein